MKKHTDKNYSTLLHIGERNSNIIDAAIANHDDLHCIHISDHWKLLSFLQESVADIIIIEYNTKYEDFIAFLSLIQRNTSTPIIVTAKCPQCSIMVKAIKSGADNFLPEPLSEETFLESVFEALRLRVLWEEVHALHDAKRSSFGRIIGAAPPMQTLYRTIENVCKTDATVFIVGESGTGKELVAKAIHDNSPRGQHPFVAINCGAIPPNLLESELFGHERGAFTGAIGRRIGKFEQAKDTTLFLDELCEMPIELQVKLLRVIQEKTLTRVGGKEEINVNPRIICATNKDPLTQVSAGLLREDLYYRLNVVPLRIPPLRERHNDIPLLCAHFLHIFAEKYSKYFYEFSPAALRKLSSYNWPGNVRELENVLERIVVLHDGSSVLEQFLPEEVINAPLRPIQEQETRISEEINPSTPSAKPIWQMEVEMIKRALAETSGNVIEASAILEIGQASLYRKLKKYNINRSDYA